jgi:hypothetical protein
LRRAFSHSTGTALCSSLLLCRGASATELEWSAPESCSKDAFVQQVEDNLQRPLARLTVDSITVTVTARTRSNWALEFSLSDAGMQAPPSRKLTGASCEDVSRTAAVAVAMALHSRVDSEGAASLPSEPATTPLPEPEAPREDQPAIVVGERADADAPGSRYRWPLQLLLLGDVSLLGTPSYGLGVGVGVGKARWEATLSAAVLPTVELRTSDTLGITLGASIGMASACFLLGDPPATPRVCLGYELGLVYGEGSGSGFSVTREQQAFWHALRPELGVGVPLAAELELRLFAGAALGLSHASFVFDAGRVAHEIPRVSARGAIAVTWVLGGGPKLER